MAVATGQSLLEEKWLCPVNQLITISRGTSTWMFDLWTNGQLRHWLPLNSQRLELPIYVLSDVIVNLVKSLTWSNPGPKLHRPTLGQFYRKVTEYFSKTRNAHNLNGMGMIFGYSFVIFCLAVCLLVFLSVCPYIYATYIYHKNLAMYV